MSPIKVEVTTPFHALMLNPAPSLDGSINNNPATTGYSGGVSGGSTLNIIPDDYLSY